MLRNPALGIITYTLEGQFEDLQENHIPQRSAVSTDINPRRTSNDAFERAAGSEIETILRRQIFLWKAITQGEVEQ